jgi:hypothetical protein
MSVETATRPPMHAALRKEKLSRRKRRFLAQELAMGRRFSGR